MAQKYHHGDFVRLRRRFVCYPVGTIAIVAGSYVDLYGPGPDNTYSVYILEKGRIVNQGAWLDEADLEDAPSLGNRYKADRFIDAYNTKQNRSE